MKRNKFRFNIRHCVVSQIHGYRFFLSLNSKDDDDDEWDWRDDKRRNSSVVFKIVLQSQTLICAQER